MRIAVSILSQRCSFIRKLEIDVLICGAVSRLFSEMLKASGIKIISEISGPAEDVLEAYLNGNLLQKKFLMPGSKNNISKAITKTMKGEKS